MTNIQAQVASTSISTDSKGVRSRIPPASVRSFNGSGPRLSGRGPNGGRYGGRGGFRQFDLPLFCQYYDRVGHTKKFCYQRQGSQSATPQAHYAGSSSSPPAWIPDSGASHHITPDFGVLQNVAPYNGSECVKIGDGKGSVLGPYIADRTS